MIKFGADEIGLNARRTMVGISGGTNSGTINVGWNAETMTEAID